MVERQEHRSKERRSPETVEVLEVSGEALGIKGRISAHTKEVWLICALLFACAMTVAAVYGITLLFSHNQESRDFSKALVHRFDVMNRTLEMQTCLSALPVEDRKTEYLNPNGFCHYLTIK